MDKVCGFKEKCFVNGEKSWGHMGGCLCEYAGEEHINGKTFGKSLLTGEQTDVYINEQDIKAVYRRNEYGKKTM